MAEDQLGSVIRYTVCRPPHLAYRRCFMSDRSQGLRALLLRPFFVICSSRSISRMRRISDQNTVQKSNVSANDSDDRLCQIISKLTVTLPLSLMHDFMKR